MLIKHQEFCYWSLILGLGTTNRVSWCYMPVVLFIGFILNSVDTELNGRMKR